MTDIASLRQDLASSQKRGDKLRVETLRFLLAEIGNLAIAKYQAAADSSLSEADVAEAVRRQVKTHNESIAAFEQGGRADLVSKEKAQLSILETFLPQELSDEEIKKILEPIVASDEKDFGHLMSLAMAKISGRAAGGRVAVLVRQMTQKKHRL